jgi:hypothetical protein
MAVEFSPELLEVVARSAFDSDHGPNKTWEGCSSSGKQDYCDLAEVALTAAYQQARIRDEFEVRLQRRGTGFSELISVYGYEEEAEESRKRCAERYKGEGEVFIRHNVTLLLAEKRHQAEAEVAWIVDEGDENSS